MSNLTFLPACTLAHLIQQQEITSRQVVEVYLRRIEKYNPQINAVVTLDAEGALRTARAADEATARGQNWGPLHGVPITIKDVYETAGMRTTSGSPRLGGYIPKQDATAVSRLRAAGAILLGKTNTPEFASGNQTDNRVFGRTNNPWDLSRTPGGSSGGAGAAIAAGFSPLDLGSDLGGSIRRPASYCGIYGLKPTDSLVPHTGHIPPPPGGRSWGLLRSLFSVGPLARSIPDLRLALAIIAGADPFHPEVPPCTLADAAPRRLETLRIAWTDDFNGLPIAAEMRTAVQELARRLAACGCQVEQTAPTGFDFREALCIDGELEQTTFFARSRMPRPLLRLAGRRLYARDPLASGYMRGAGATLGSYTNAMVRRDQYIERLESFLGQWDAWLLPATPTPAFPHLQVNNHFDMLRAELDIDGKAVSYFAATSTTLNPFNMTGGPAVVLPFGQTHSGLPVGVQLVGRRWHDMELLAAAEAIAEACCPFQAPPGYDEANDA